MWLRLLQVMGKPRLILYIYIYICMYIYIYIYIYIYATPPLMYPRFVLESCAISETGPNYRVFKRIQGVFN